MRVAICDDISAEREKIKVFLRRFEQEGQIECVTREYSCGEKLIADLGKTPWDILLLDIYMGGMGGMDVARQLKAQGFGGQIIFTTTSLDHAVDSYRIAAEGYLVKPFSYEEFAGCFSRAAAKWGDSYKSITVISDRLEFHMYQKDIDYIETFQRGSLIHAKGEQVKSIKPLGYFEKLLTPEACFLRCGRYFIVNLNQVKRTDEEFVYMKNGEKIRLPMRNGGKIRQSIVEYYWKITRE